MKVKGSFKTIMFDNKIIAQDKTGAFVLTIFPDNIGVDFNVTCICVYGDVAGEANISFATRPTILYTDTSLSRVQNIELNHSTRTANVGMYTLHRTGPDMIRVTKDEEVVALMKLVRNKIIVDINLDDRIKENVVLLAVACCGLVSTVYEVTTENVHLRSLFGEVKERIRKLRKGNKK